MKKLTKLLSAMLVVMMVVSSVASAVTITPGGGAVAFGTNPTKVTNFIGCNRSVNGALADKDNDTQAGTVGYATKGMITFTFDEDMDVDTLIPENIKIFGYIASQVNTAGAAISQRGLKNDRYNDDKSVNYQPYSKSAREYVIWMGDLASRGYRITFSSNVKTAAGEAITEQTFVVSIGKNAKMPYREGKRIVKVGYNKPAIDQDGTVIKTTLGTNITGDPCGYSNASGNAKITAGGWWKIDLGNIYEVADVTTYDGYNPGDRCTQKIEIYYSSDPNSGFGADQVTPTLWGELGTANRLSSETLGSNNATGVDGDRWLNPANTVNARYIFVKNIDSATAKIQGLDIFGYVDNYYTTITAEKGGEAVTNFTGGGAYTFKAPVIDYVDSDDATAYMIVAGYDVDGIITNIKCEPVSYDGGYLTLDATMPDNTVKAKAALIESFTSPYLLTDALELLPAQ